MDIGSIVKFFATDIGKKVIRCNVLREFKFTVLQKASSYFADAPEDELLLQGVVDLAILEEDGITVIDFKTDVVTKETLLSVANGYFSQVRAYSQALEQIYNKPVKQSLLYFFRAGEFVDVK